jgi:hypothetical protein
VGLSGYVGAAAQDGLLEILTARRLQEEMAREEKARAHGRKMEETRLEESRKRREFDEERARRGDKREEASALTSALDAGFDPLSPLNVEVSEGQAAQLQGTPEAARVQEIPTLPAKPTVPGMSQMGAPGIGVRRLMPTGEQQGQRRVVDIRRRVSGELAGATNEADRRRAAAGAFEAGINPPEALMRPTMQETAAAQEAERKRDLEDFTTQESIRARFRPRTGGGSAPEQTWVVRDGQVVPITKGTARPGDQPYDAVAARQPTAPGNSEALETATELVRVATDLRDHPSRGSVFGAFEGAMPSFRQGSIDAQTLVDQLNGLLALENMGKMKGVLSDKDMAMIRQASSRLSNQRIGDAAAYQELTNVINTVSQRLGGMDPSGAGPAQDVGEVEYVRDPRTGRLVRK